ncbi:hypothetical protein NECAME_11063 [Necator americanus]|uniref:Secreted protein n=1 Tax=Necator americanus TaxID=51031 RepID=W2T5V2_NECAM|nr:hypothetical protein NECAME_11063 [Necator americanus]ETN77395.1 hypothetical protein NECAME_11063 [Necator americanus]
MHKAFVIELQTTALIVMFAHVVSSMETERLEESTRQGYLYLPDDRSVSAVARGLHTLFSHEAALKISRTLRHPSKNKHWQR